MSQRTRKRHYYRRFWIRSWRAYSPYEICPVTKFYDTPRTKKGN